MRFDELTLAAAEIPGFDGGAFLSLIIWSLIALYLLWDQVWAERTGARAWKLFPERKSNPRAYWFCAVCNIVMAGVGVGLLVARVVLLVAGTGSH